MGPRQYSATHLEVLQYRASHREALSNMSHMEDLDNTGRLIWRPSNIGCT
jgi:hypothetical protein